MTHEAGIEAAVYQFQAAELDENNGIDDFVSEIIQAYLSASGMVLVPREPTAEMFEASYLWYKFVRANEPDANATGTWRAMLSVAPDAFKSKP